MLVFGFLGVYFIIESGLTKYRPMIGHASGITVVLGIIASFITWLKINSWNKDPDRDTDSRKQIVIEDLQFDAGLFFHLLLPIIIFPSGYNMRRKKFFKNFKTIIWFGFLGSFLCFLFYYAMIYTANSHDLLVKWDAAISSYKPLNINVFELASIGALLCSGDVISTLSQVSFEMQPNIYSVIYGEGIFNNLVSIVLVECIDE